MQQMPMRYLKKDVLKSQLRFSVEARLPACAAQTAALTLQRSTTQITNPLVTMGSQDVLRRGLAEAAQNASATLEQGMQKAIESAVNCLADNKAHAEQVFISATSANIAKVASVFDAEAASPKFNQVIQASLVKALGEMLMESHDESTAAMSIAVLRWTVEGLLRNEVFPKMLETVMSSYVQYAQELVRNVGVFPAAPPQVRDYMYATAVEASAETIELSKHQGPPPVAVPVLELASADARGVVPPRQFTPQPLPQPRPVCEVASPRPAPQQKRVHKTGELISFRSARGGPTPVRAEARPRAQRQVQLDEVPDEMLLHVLVQLDPAELLQCSLVCRRWRRLCRSDALWRRKRIRYDPAARASFLAALRQAPVLAMVDCRAMAAGDAPPHGLISDHDLLRLLHESCSVRGLRLPLALPGLPPSVIVSVLERHKGTLERLHLTCDPGCQASDLAAVLDAVDHLPELRRLSLAGHFDVNFTFLPRKMGAPRRKIQHLDLSGYSSSSPDTAKSLLRAYAASLQTLSLHPGADSGVLSFLTQCSRLRDLTVAADVLGRWPCSALPAVWKLTLTRPRARHQDAHAVLPGGIPIPDSPFHARNLGELVLDGVLEAADIPLPVLAVVSSVHTLTLRRASMDGHAQFLSQLPELEELVLDQVEDLTDDYLRELTRGKPHLRRVSILRSLNCTDSVCWKPLTNFLQASWPEANVFVDLNCTCSQ